MSNAKATTKRSLVDIVKDQGIKERKLAGDARINFAGISASSSPLGGSSGKSGSLQNITPVGSFLKTSGDTMVGAIAFHPAAAIISAGAIDISKATTSSFSSYVILTGEGGVDDTLATITGPEHAGQILYIQPILTNQITLTETGGNLILPGGNDVVLNAAKDGRTVVKLIFDVTVNANKWTLVSNSESGVAGGNEFADNLFRIFDDIDGTRKLAFQVGGIAPASTTRTLTVQNASGTIPLLDGSAGTQIFSNAIQMNGVTLDMDGNDLILDADADSRFITSVDDVLTLNLFGSAQFVWNVTRFDIGAKDYQLSEIANPGAPGSTSGRIFLDSADNTLKIRKSSGTVSLEGGNPPFDDNQDIIQDDVDNTKKLQFSLASFATGTTSIIGSNTLTAARIWSFPDATGVIPLLGLAQTWTATQDHNATVRSLINGGTELGDVTHHWDDVFTETLTFKTSGGNTSGTIRAIHGSVAGLAFLVPSGDQFEFIVSGGVDFTIRNTKAFATDNGGYEMGDSTHFMDDVFSETFTLRGSGGNTTGSDRTIYADAFSMILNMPTGDDIGFKINNVTEFAFSATSFTIGTANNIVLSTGTGTKIGTSTAQKLGFWNATPVIQQTVASDTLANLYTALRATGVIG